MSENIETVKRAMDAFNRRDLGSVLAACDPEVEWTPPAALPGSRTYHGHDGVLEAINDMLGVFGDLRAEPLDFVSRGDTVVGIYMWRGRAGASGISVDPFAVEVGFVCEFRDGLVTSMSFFNDPEQARQVAGLDA